LREGKLWSVFGQTDRTRAIFNQYGSKPLFAVSAEEFPLLLREINQGGVPPRFDAARLPRMNPQ
jgi:hypothetical protein